MKIFPITPGNDPGLYTEPSPMVETIILPGGGQNLYVNAEYRHDEDKSLRPPGEAHRRGNCGGYYGLCGTCWDLEHAWHRKIARRIVTQAQPKPGENIVDYCVRVRCRMVDTWHDVFSLVLLEHQTKTLQFQPA